MLLAKVAKRVSDPAILHLLKLILRAGSRKGLPQGGPLSPLLSNIYLTPVEHMLERAQETTRPGPYRYLTYARWADDLVILVDGYRRHNWRLGAANRRVREELVKLGISVNEEKSRVVDLERGERSPFWASISVRCGVCEVPGGGTHRRDTSARSLLQKLREVFRRLRSQPARRVIEEINPILAGWLAYFRIGHAGRHFAYIRRWVEQKVRRHVERAAQRPGFGWKRWSREWFYGELGFIQ